MIPTPQVRQQQNRRRSESEEFVAGNSYFRVFLRPAARVKYLCGSCRSSCGGAVGMVVFARDCVRLLANQWVVGLARRRVARSHECIRSRQPAGVEIQPSLLRAEALALAPVPLCIYGAILLRERRRITPT